jgi:5-methylcytosine-specific restriction endonuclease McrA
MSDIRFTSKAPFDERRNKGGEKICRMCGGALSGRRTSFCGEPCVHEFMMRSNPGYAQSQVRERDKGICAHCGRDIEAIHKRAYHAYKRATRTGFAIDYHQSIILYRRRMDRFEKWRKASGWPDVLRVWWEAHHITAVVEGGGLCGLDGYITLCVQCHKRESAALAARRAKPKPDVVTIAGIQLELF